MYADVMKVDEIKKNALHKECLFGGFLVKTNALSIAGPSKFVRIITSSPSAPTKNERCIGGKVNHIKREKRIISTSLMCTT